MKKFLLRYLPVILWMCLIFFVSSKSNLPTSGTLTEDFLTKKSAHLFEYTILMFLMYRAVSQKSPAKAFLFCLIFAYTDEIHQLFIPTRAGQLRDVGIDSIGVILSTLLIIKFQLWNSSLLLPQLKRPNR